MRIAEITVSVSRKVPLEQYGGEEFFAAAKGELETGDGMEASFARLFDEAQAAAEARAEKARADHERSKAEKAAAWNRERGVAAVTQR